MPTHTIPLTSQQRSALDAGRLRQVRVPMEPQPKLIDGRWEWVRCPGLGWNPRAIWRDGLNPLESRAAADLLEFGPIDHGDELITEAGQTIGVVETVRLQRLSEARAGDAVDCEHWSQYPPWEGIYAAWDSLHPSCPGELNPWTWVYGLDRTGGGGEA